MTKTPAFTNTKKDTTEYKLQVAIVDYLHGRKRVGRDFSQMQPPFAGMLITHAYQGRSKEEGFFLKALGVKAGIADLLCWYKTPTGYGCSFVEVKKQGGYQSPAQNKIQSQCHFMGIPYVVVRSVKDVYNHFVAQGLEPSHHLVIEPDLRNEAQKKADSFDYYRPQ